MECEVCSKPIPDEPREAGWLSAPSGGEEDAPLMWFCPECIEKWGDE